MSKSSEHMSQQELESYLWGAAKLLRGLIDAGDYKQFVFPLLFFKRLSDVWDEEYQTAFEETGDEDYARATANDRFAIPDGAHWSDVRGASRDVGRALLNAFRAIETANPERLSGAFGNASWTDKAQLPDETLKNLIEHFSKHTLASQQFRKMSWATGTSTSSSSLQMTAVILRRSSTRIAHSSISWCRCLSRSRARVSTTRPWNRGNADLSSCRGEPSGGGHSDSSFVRSGTHPHHGSHCTNELGAARG